MRFLPMGKSVHPGQPGKPLGRFCCGQSPTISFSDHFSASPFRPGSPTPGGHAVLTPRTLGLCLCHLPDISFQSRRGILLRLQRSKSSLRQGTLRHSSTDPLRYNLFSSTTAQGAPLGHLKLHHMMAPDASTLLEIPQLPPLLHSQSFYCPVSAIRSFFAKITSLPFYRAPKTLGWPTKDAALAPLSHQDKISPSFANLFHILQLLPNFFPSEVRAIISAFKIEESSGLSFFYTFEALTHLKQLGIRPGTSSTNMSHPYDWPLGWDLNGFTCILEPRSFLAPLYCPPTQRFSRCSLTSDRISPGLSLLLF